MVWAFEVGEMPAVAQDYQARSGDGLRDVGGASNGNEIVISMCQVPAPLEGGLVRTPARHRSPIEGTCETSLPKIRAVFPLVV